MTIRLTLALLRKSVRQSKSLAFPGISRISATGPVLCKITENRKIAQFLRFSPTLQFSRDSKYSRWYSESLGYQESHCFRQPPTHNVGRPSAAHIKRGEPPLYEHCEWAVVWNNEILDFLGIRYTNGNISNPSKIARSGKIFKIEPFFDFAKHGPRRGNPGNARKSQGFALPDCFFKNAKVSRIVIFGNFGNFWNFGISKYKF